MEQKSCSLFGRCRDRNTGKLTKVSELHRDLVGLGKIQSAFTRQKANKAFYLSQNPKFLDRYQEDLVFTSEDADAEPKLASFFEAAKQTMPEVKMDDIRELLAKKFGEGVYSFDDAYSKMSAFNKQMDGGTLFMGTLIPQEDGKYMFKIVPNSSQEQNALMQVMADRNTADTIIQHLENLGVGVADGVKALYNSKNPSVISKGLLGLITLQGGKEAAAYHIKDLASETGHTIVGMLGEDNKLYQRLKKIIEEQPEVARELLGDEEYARYQGTENATKEFMGHIIGLYLEQWDNINPNSKLKTVGTLIQRMVDWIKSRLHFTNRDYHTALYNAKWTAYNMTKDFMSNNFQGTLENAMSNGGEVLRGDLEIVYGHLTTSLQKLHEMVESSKDFGYRTHKNYSDIFHQLMTDFHEISLMKKEATTTFTEQQIEENASEALMKLINFLVNEMQQTKTLLEFAKNGVDAKGNPISLAERAKVIKYSQQVLNMVNQTLKFKDDYQYIVQDDLKEEIKRVFELLSNTINTISSSASGRQINGNYQDLIDEARKKLALELLVQINGSDFIAISQHVSFKDGKLVKTAAHLKNMSDILDHNQTTSFVSRFIDSLADSPDITNQLIYDIIEQKKHEANIKTLDIKDRLFAMYGDLKKAGISDTRVFYETDSLGHLTGNLISERNWGEWERLYKEDKKKWEDDWYENNKDMFSSKADMYNNAIFLTAFGAWREGWHNDHSVKIELKDADGNPLKYEDGKIKKRWAPVIKTDPQASSKPFDFYNEKWDKLQDNPKAAQWLKEYMKLKQELDSLLPDGSTNALGVRAPQFMGTHTDRLTNAFKGDGSLKRVLGMSMRKYLIHNVAASPADTEYGGENDTYNNDDLHDRNGSVIFTRAHANALKSIERVPMYGVRKLPHMDDLSTDLIHSTLAYAAMATSYNSLSEVADIASQIAETKHAEDKTSTILSWVPIKVNLPTGYHRLVDYLQQQVYNNYADPYLGGAGSKAAKSVSKVTGLVSRLGSVWMLGFNMHSAITNAYTGFNEIWKEAHAGEEFNKRDFIWAINRFWWSWWGGFFQNVCNIAMQKGSIIESTTKLDLFNRMFDIQNENERKFRDYHIQTKGYGLMHGWSYTNLAMLPYSVTDMWMQNISFLAAARHTKLKNKKTGEVCSLYDAYEVVDQGKGKNPKLALRGDAKDWTIFNKNQARLNEIISDKARRGISLTTAEMKAVYQYEKVPDIDPATGEQRKNADGSLKFKVDPKRDPTTGEQMLIDPYVEFDSRQQNRFRTRCRAINNRMHGVYNRGDGGAFQKLAIASMAASMKKYAIGLIDRRFSFARYDFRTGETRQGSTITMGTIIYDCFTAFSLGEESNVRKVLEKYNVPKLRHAVNAAANLVLGITKFMYITTGALGISKLGVDQYLRKQGYSETQITNVRRFWGDIFRPVWIKFIMSFLAPPAPDDDDDDEKSALDYVHAGIQEGVDYILENRLTNWISDKMLDAYIASVKASLFGADATIKDERILTKEYLNNVVKKKNKDKDAHAFSVKSILYYQLYRGLLEQKAYEITRPLSMFQEYKGLTDSALPGLTSLYDISMTAGLVTQAAFPLDEEDLEELSDKDKKKYHDGKEVYTRGNNKYWYKWAKKVLKVGPMRTAETWFNGYASYESMKYYKEPFDKEKYQEGVFNINRR